MATATQLTVSDAAAHVGVTRQTIFKQIKAGKLSATTNRKGHKQINVVELMRVYGELQSPEQVAQNRVNRQQQATPATATAGIQLELERAKMMLEKKDFELEQLRFRVEELKERERESKDEKHKLLTIIDRQTLLLAAPKPPESPAVVKKVPTKRVAAVAAKTATAAKTKPLDNKKATPIATKSVAKTVAKKTTRK